MGKWQCAEGGMFFKNLKKELGMKYGFGLILLAALTSTSCFAGLQLAKEHLISKEPWVIESVDDEAICHAGLVKLVLGNRGMGVVGMQLPALEKIRLVIDKDKVFELEPELIYGVNAAYLLSSKVEVKSAVMNARTVELVTRNCENKPLNIFSTHGCPKTFTWTFEQPLEKCTLPSD